MRIRRVKGGELQLIDGRALHNNGWFIVRSLVQPGATDSAIEWIVTPNALPNWKAAPVVQVSQVGYHPAQSKVAIFELDKKDMRRPKAALLRVVPSGFETVFERWPKVWGKFLRFRYLRLDFSEVQEPGMYVVRYGQTQSSPFRIDTDVYERGIWQPTLEYFLPVQMCHLRINENYRVWHGSCHLDDARMAPLNHLHHDGYEQGASSLCRFKRGEHVPGLNQGGWHDAGDYDLRVESQAQTVHGLALAYEEFGLDYDNTTVDQVQGVVELLKPDGKPDVLQQIEHGLLSIVGGYRALGRLYRGIVEAGLRQYTHLGDASTVTDNKIDEDGLGDDRWVFTEENPARELETAAALAAASRVLPGFNDELAGECLVIARELYDRPKKKDPLQRVEAALELLISTGEDRFARFLTESVDEISGNPAKVGWLAARSLSLIADPSYHGKVKDSLREFRQQFDKSAASTPYGIPYVPAIWGAGWTIQRIGVQQYWLHKACPEIFPLDYMLNALNFVLGCHPGSNPASFVSGVGARSLIPGYGINRADESFIPGGIAAGTALIRPDFPELLEWPHLWQQAEYCLGHSTTDYIFLVVAADRLLNAS